MATVARKCCCQNQCGCLGGTPIGWEVTIATETVFPGCYSPFSTTGSLEYVSGTAAGTYTVDSSESSPCVSDAEPFAVSLTINRFSNLECGGAPLSVWNGPLYITVVETGGKISCEMTFNALRVFYGEADCTGTAGPYTITNQVTDEVYLPGDITVERLTA